MRKHLLNWHLYLGLLVAPYALVYAVSALAFNHGLKGDSGPPTTEIRAVTIPEAPDDRALARALSEQLDVRGWLPPGKIRRQGPDQLEFQIGRPGARVTIAVDEAAGEARIGTQHKGIVSVLQGLHGLHDLGGTFWGRTWAVYTEASAWVLGLAFVSGMLLWLPRPSARAVGGTCLALGAAATLLLVAWIW